MSLIAMIASRDRKEALLKCLFLFVSFVSLHASAAPEVEPLASLNFGVLAITSNDQISTLELSRGGSLEVSGALVIIDRPSPGKIRLAGFPPSTAINVDVTEAQLTAGDSGIPEPLIVNQYEAGNVFTDSQGETEFQLGATFSTSGNGGAYEDALYSGDAVLSLTYWEPSVEDYVAVSEPIALQGEVRSGIQLEEINSMGFGKVFARADPDNQASYILNPDGEHAIQNKGNARIVALSNASSGILSIDGAAPGQLISINIQAGEILIRNTDNPSGLYFILDELETLPDLVGRTNETGQLEIKVGGRLKTQFSDEIKVYPAGSYEGTYTLTVSY